MNKFNPIMKRLLALVLAALCFTSTVFAQPVNVSLRNTPIRSVLREVTRQTGYNFVYSDALTGIDRSISVNYTADELDIEELLDRIFAGTDVKYSITDKQVALLDSAIEQGSARVTGTVRSQQAPLPNSGQITGVIKHGVTGENMVGVVVNVKGTKIYTTSDANGVYKIMAPSNAKLTFTFIGMLVREIDVASRTNIPVSLDPDMISIKEIVVTGYQSLEKERATGSFGIVGVGDMENKLQPNIATVLEGQVAGLTVNQNNQLTIRGVGTLNASAAPLIVVDGFPVDASTDDDAFYRYQDGILENINTDNVESITVLKDGVAASIYGARAANGVVVITTKKGRQGDAKFSYKGTLGFAPRPNLNNLNKASTNDYIDAEIDFFNLSPSAFNINSGTDVISRVPYLLKQVEQGDISQAEADAEISRLRGNNYLKDLEKYVYRPALSHQHNFLVNGGSESNSYNVAVNYMKALRSFKHSDNDRLTVDIRDEWKFNKFVTVGASVNLTYSNLKTPAINPDRAFRSGDSYGSQTLFNFGPDSYFTPYTSIVDENGDAANIWGLSVYKQNTYADYDGMKSVEYDLLNDISRSMITTRDFQARLTGFVRADIIDGLNIEVGGNWQRGSYKYQKTQDKTAFAVREAYNDSKSKSNNANHYLPDGAIVDENRNNNESWTIRTQINFNRSFGGSKHRITALVGSEVRKTTTDKIVLATRAGYNEIAGSFTPINILDYNSTVYANDMLFGRRITFATGGYGYRDNRFVSWYGNASYEFDDRFIVSGSIRLDLTNFFGTDPKYRYKPLWSVGGTWKLSNERFFDVNFIDRLYVRASYGLNGNIKLDQGPFLILSNGGYNSVAQGMRASIFSPPNNQLRWEKTKSINVGVDATLFYGRVDLSVDWYQKRSSDVLANESTDQTTGYISVMMNAGRILNSGIEVSVGAKIIDNANFGWRLSSGFSFNRNMVKEYNVQKPYVGDYLVSSGINIEGYPVDGLWSLHSAPLNSTGNAMIYNKEGEVVLSSQARPEDTYYVGPTRPLYDISITNRFNYKNWELSFMFISKLGHYYLKDAFDSRNIQDKHVGERWRKPGDEAWATVPALSITNSDFWYSPYMDNNVNRANFARLRDVTVSYSFNREFIQKIGLGNAKIYVQGRNLMTLKAKGMDIDPETMISYADGFATLPLPKEIYVGLQLTF